MKIELIQEQAHSLRGTCFGNKKNIPWPKKKKKKKKNPENTTKKKKYSLEEKKKKKKKRNLENQTKNIPPSPRLF